MGTRRHSMEDILELMKDPESLRCVGLVGHIDHGKTTLSDSLLAEAGLLNESLVGEARALDYLEEEQRRGITMKSANVSLYYEKGIREKPFLINLVDTPGHLDFSGKVTRALRLIDGVVVIVDAVEEINSQSEIVVKQALEEAVKPILFINKIDRLYRELKLTNEEIKNKLNHIITTFNSLIDRFSDEKYKIGWKVNPENGSVIFGSALHKWGFTISKILAYNWTFKNISEKYQNDDYEDLASIFPVWESILSAIITHLPNPKESQKYRIKAIWDGKSESDLGKSMLNCDPNGPLVMCMSNIKYDVHGLISTGRVFSGTLRKGDKVYLLDHDSEERIMKVAIYMGARMDNATEIPAGNIAAVGGLKKVRSGETIVSSESKDVMTSFENVKYVSQPVVTVAIEPEMLKNLNSLQENLDHLLIEDPNLFYEISSDTGEVLLSGLGPLHLEVAVKELEEKGMNITVSKPMSVFRESIMNESSEVTVSSSDNTMILSLKVERNDLKTINFLKKIKLTAYPSYTQIITALKKNTSLKKKETNGYIFSDVYGNLVLNGTNNIRFEVYSGRKKQKQQLAQNSKHINQHMIHVKDTLIGEMNTSFRNMFLSGPLCRERLAELKITLTNLELKKLADEHFIADITILLREAVFKALKQTGSVLLEPVYELIIQAPPDQVGAITPLLAQHQSRITEISQNEYSAQLQCYMSVREYIDFSTELRSRTSGRAFWQTHFYSFEEVPENIRDTIITEIKFRKGMFY
ncbi:MAG: GTP-binding protein [Candidatus Lokiarchaeota archaeon]|nr:GTP-binding protein [Candidatus Lokiarchaeota archaeon]